ncbi:uncharacterized protein [Miscanthus floridulus]|uniref:uncharacterized protein isoform X1 n=1 Tax=Miscanthus floridulus TaxID=154761 RepID=UPI003459E14D
MKQRKIDVVSSKKQVAEHSYEATNLVSSTPATININIQMEQDDYVEHKDLPAHYKYNCTKHKEKHTHNGVMVDKSKCTNEIKVEAKETSATQILKHLTTKTRSQQGLVQLYLLVNIIVAQQIGQLAIQ